MGSSFRIWPEQASTIAGRVDGLYGFLIAVAVFFSGLIFLLVLYFAIKYRRRPGNMRAQQIGTHNWLEMTWILIPLAITMVVFVWGAKLYAMVMLSPPANSLEVYAIGKQWMWKFQHPDGQREIDELHVPVGHPVKMTMTAQDAIHSFYVPAFRIKMDVVPGRYTTTWFEASKPGVYHLFCAEYCGCAMGLPWPRRLRVCLGRRCSSRMGQRCWLMRTTCASQSSTRAPSWWPVMRPSCRRFRGNSAKRSLRNWCPISSRSSKSQRVGGKRWRQLQSHGTSTT